MVAAPSWTSPILFFLFLDGVQNIRTGGHRPRIDTGERQRTDERVVHDLERQSGQGFVVRRVTNGFLAFRSRANDGRNVQRGRQIIDDRVQHRLNAFVFERRTAQDGNEAHGNRAFANALLQRFQRDFLAFQVVFHRLIVLFDDGFDHFGMVLVGQFLQIGGNFTVSEFGAQMFAVPDDRTFVQNVDNTRKFGFGADRS